MEYIWKKFPEEIIKGDNITESGFNYEEEYEKRVYKKVWMDIAWYCGRNGRRIFVLAVKRHFVWMVVRKVLPIHWNLLINMTGQKSIKAMLPSILPATWNLQTLVSLFLCRLANIM